MILKMFIFILQIVIFILQIIIFILQNYLMHHRFILGHRMHFKKKQFPFERLNRAS